MCVIDAGILPTWLNVPATSGSLRVGSEHSVYWRSFGDADAQPVIALHGGPGSGLNPRYLDFFDPERHRVVMFDQRGCGQSTPSGATSRNTTQDLIADIETLRCHLRINRWLVFGSSWGACLGLLYGQIHPGSCTGLVLVGLSNRHDHQTRWILEERARLLPERHEMFLAALSQQERSNPVEAYHRKSLSPHRQDQLEVAHAAWVLEAGLETAEPQPAGILTLDAISQAMVKRAKLYFHYWANRTFLPHGHLLVDPLALAEMPVSLVHGAVDWICPRSGAQRVADAIEAPELVVVSGAGHSPFSADMTQALRGTIRRIT